MITREKIHNLVNQYNKGVNLPPVKLISTADLPLETSATIAAAFDNAANDLTGTDTRRAYGQFIRELVNQYSLLSQYIHFEFTAVNPYENQSKLMFKDIEENGHLLVFTGGEHHPTMRDANKIFRAVHDVFGHYINYNSFSFTGEYRAYLHHKQTFSPLAQRALFSETIAQNSYYRIHQKFSEQKTVILPEGITALC